MTTPATFSDIPRVTPAHLGLALGLSILTLLAWCLPRVTLATFTSAVRDLYLAALGINSPATEHVAALLNQPSAQADSVLRSLASNDLYAAMTLLRCHRLATSFPAIELRGTQHLQASLKQGLGVMLWVDHVVQGSLATKVALDQAGFALTHLSHSRHGFSNTQLGRCWLNPLKTRVGDRYLR